MCSEKTSCSAILLLVAHFYPGRSLSARDKLDLHEAEVRGTLGIWSKTLKSP